MKKTMLRGLLTAAGCALFAGSAAALNVSDTFESSMDPWTGNAELFQTNYTYGLSVGYPGGSSTHTKVLAVEGTANRSAPTTSGNPATVDMMVQIALPDEELNSFPNSVSDQGNIQIALGVTTNETSVNLGSFKLWCKDKSGTSAAAWYNLPGTYDKDSWQRVSFTFDFDHSLCQVRVNGEPIMSEYGFLTTDTSANNGVNGSWYRLANGTSSTALSQVQVIGCTAIDDVVIKDDTTISAVLPVLADAATTRTSSGVAVANSWIEAQGITREQANASTMPDGTAMTIGQKYAAGYEATDGKTFGVKAMKMTGTNARFEFDTAVMDRGYKYVLQTSSDGSTWSDTDLVAADLANGYKEVALGDDTVKYYRLKVVTQ